MTFEVVVQQPVVVTPLSQDPVTSSPTDSKNTPVPKTKTPDPAKPVTSDPTKEISEPPKNPITSQLSNAQTSSNIQVGKTLTQNTDVSSVLEEGTYWGSYVIESDIDINDSSKKDGGKTNLGDAVGVPVASVGGRCNNRSIVLYEKKNESWRRKLRIIILFKNNSFVLRLLK